MYRSTLAVLAILAPADAQDVFLAARQLGAGQNEVTAGKEVIQEDPCSKDSTSCACFVHRDANFCTTCPECGTCHAFCGQPEPPRGDDPCLANDESCDCFIHRDANFCQTCPDCGPCGEHCAASAPEQGQAVASNTVVDETFIEKYTPDDPCLANDTSCECFTHRDKDFCSTCPECGPCGTFCAMQGHEGPCSVNDESCECFAARDSNFCSTCPECGSCGDYCAGTKDSEKLVAPNAVMLGEPVASNAVMDEGSMLNSASSEDPCLADGASCECFIHRDSNFCSTCPECGPCGHFCAMKQDPCSVADQSCECFVDRDSNFCSTCPECGPCGEFCAKANP